MLLICFNLQCPSEVRCDFLFVRFSQVEFRDIRVPRLEDSCTSSINTMVGGAICIGDHQFLRMGGKYFNGIVTFFFDNGGRFFFSAGSQEVLNYRCLWVKVHS